LERRVRAYIGLGSNVGDPWASLAQAVAALARLPGARLRRISRLYATTPVGVRAQPDFLNAVVALDVLSGPDAKASALQLLADLKVIERQLGRQVRGRWGPREIDLDLLLFGRHTVNVERPPELASAAASPGRARNAPPPETKYLQVPHHDVAERLFVLAPLSELAPRLVPPGWRETVSSARRRREAVEGASAARVTGTWDARERRWIPRA
jgi:2-amino-4-hydroxy-6-hydroxymethyldihydropteridine diphosphokinase